MNHEIRWNQGGQRDRPRRPRGARRRSVAQLAALARP